MRWRLPLAAISVVALIALPLLSFADYNVQDKGTYYSNAQTGARTNSTGDARVEEVSPAMDANLGPIQMIGTGGAGTTLSIGGADSTASPQDTHRMRLGTLLIKGVLGGTGTVDTTCVATIAIQIRTHLNAVDDSSSTFAFYPYGVTPSMVATSTAADTSLAGHIYAGVPQTGIAATPGSNTAWSGEITMQLSAKRNAHGSTIAVNGHTFYYPSGIALPISSLFGRDLYSQYTTVRVRVLKFQKGSASLTTGQVTLTCWLTGTPL